MFRSIYLKISSVRYRFGIYYIAAVYRRKLPFKIHIIRLYRRIAVLQTSIITKSLSRSGYLSLDFSLGSPLRRIVRSVRNEKFYTCPVKRRIPPVEQSLVRRFFICKLPVNLRRKKIDISALRPCQRVAVQTVICLKSISFASVSIRGSISPDPERRNSESAERTVGFNRRMAFLNKSVYRFPSEIPQLRRIGRTRRNHHISRPRQDRDKNNRRK